MTTSPTAGTSASSNEWSLLLVMLSLGWFCVMIGASTRLYGIVGLGIVCWFLMALYMRQLKNEGKIQSAKESDS